MHDFLHYGSSDEFETLHVYSKKWQKKIKFLPENDRDIYLNIII